MQSKQAAPIQGYQKLMTRLLTGIGYGKLPQRRYTVQKGIKTMNPPSPKPSISQHRFKLSDVKEYIDMMRK